MSTAKTEEEGWASANSIAQRPVPAPRSKTWEAMVGF